MIPKFRIHGDGAELVPYTVPELFFFAGGRTLCFDAAREGDAIGHWHDEIELLYVTEGSMVYNVNLEKCRYGDSVELRIHVPEELRQIIIPRFLLQPIVENSFEHGFTGMAPEEKRQIIITARKMGDRMVLRVRDNGRGMSLKQVEEMNQKFSQPYDAVALRHQKERGIGLDNINDRLQIFSHSKDRLVLRSREGKYTSMFILQTL